MLRGAIIGFGGVAANGHFPAYASQSDLEVKAVVDPSADRRAHAEALGLRVYPSMSALFESEPVDFIDVCTPPSLHWSPMRTALERGMHVLCEKPFLLRVAELDEVVRLSQTSGACAFPAHNWKHAPMVRLATGHVQRGDIGKVRDVDFCTYRRGHCKGAQGDAEDWRLHPNTAGGGILIDHGWHAFYLLLQWIESDPTRVLATVSRPGPGELEDEVDVRVDFEDGSKARIMLTWRAQARRNTLTIEGEHGAIRIDGERLTIETQDGGGTAQAEALSAGSHHTEWFRGVLSEFYAAIAEPVRRMRALREVGWCLALTQGVYEAERTRVPRYPVALPASLSAEVG
jgi:predicted dehydrogenase